MPLFGVLIDLPSATTSLAEMSQYSVPLFDEFKGYIFAGLGVLLVLFIVRKVFSKF